MARIVLEFPEQLFVYKTLLTVRITDINAGNHLGNDAMISMISEARSRFLHDHRIPEGGSADPAMIVTDLATTYRAEAHARDQLQFEVGAMDLNRYGGDIIFRVTRPADGRLIAMAKSGFVYFDYASGTVIPMADEIRARFTAAART